MYDLPVHTADDVREELRGIFFIVDAVQAFGRISSSMAEEGWDDCFEAGPIFLEKELCAKEDTPTKLTEQGNALKRSSPELDEAGLLAD